MKNKKAFVIIVLFCFIWVAYGFFKAKIDKKERINFGIQSVSKIVKFKGASGSKFLDFIYFIDNKMYKEDWYRGNQPNVKVGEYYKIIYSSKDPKNVEIFLDERVTDTVLIKNAGFDIK